MCGADSGCFEENEMENHLFSTCGFGMELLSGCYGGGVLWESWKGKGKGRTDYC